MKTFQTNQVDENVNILCWLYHKGDLKDLENDILARGIGNDKSQNGSKVTDV